LEFTGESAHRQIRASVIAPIKRQSADISPGEGNLEFFSRADIGPRIGVALIIYVQKSNS
jgi:hypothetical protein